MLLGSHSLWPHSQTVCWPVPQCGHFHHFPFHLGLSTSFSFIFSFLHLVSVFFFLKLHSIYFGSKEMHALNLKHCMKYLHHCRVSVFLISFPNLELISPFCLVVIITAYRGRGLYPNTWDRWLF